MSAMYLSWEEASTVRGLGTGPPHGPPPSGWALPPPAPHVFGLDAGLLGADMAIVVFALVVALALLQLPGDGPGS